MQPTATDAAHVAAAPGLESSFRDLVDVLPFAVMVLQDEVIVFANPAAHSLLGYDDVIGLQYERFIHADDLPLVAERVRRVRLGMTNPPAELRWCRKTGAVVWVEAASFASRYDGRPAAVVAGTDVTARRDAEQHLVASVREKELLLREIHHRIKNNLQLVSSMLYVQAEIVPDEEARSSLMESQARVNTVALVHDHLYRSQDLARLDVRAYMESLVASVAAAFDPLGQGIETSIAVEDVHLEGDKAIACGLVVCELVTNAVKHAFVGRSTGTIAVSLRRVDDDVILRVADDGIGMPAGFDPRKTGSLGYELVDSFAQQLHGTLRIERDDGTAVQLRFPMPGQFQSGRT